MKTGRGRVKVLIAAAGGLVLAACAGVQERDASAPAARAATQRMPERAAAFAIPEPDPACRATVRDSLYSNGLDKVVVKLARAPDGRARVVEFLSPDLTPAAKVDLTRAYGTCIWSPVTAPPAAPASEVIWTETIHGGSAQPQPPSR